ncbi:MAG: helix-turn-helix transcriptional regulator [Pseudomonadota bacterium]
MRSTLAFIAIVAVQVLCTVFFVGEILASVLGIAYRPINWRLMEVIEVSAALGLLLGLVFGIMTVRRSMTKAARAEDALRAASGAFMELVEDRFDEWKFTPAERDVALFALKGLSLGEIAGLRNTSEGTVKAQTAAIYRKAEVSGRPQFLSLFVEDLIDLSDPT